MNTSEANYLLTAARVGTDHDQKVDLVVFCRFLWVTYDHLGHFFTEIGLNGCGFALVVCLVRISVVFGRVLVVFFRFLARVFWFLANFARFFSTEFQNFKD
jgi:hypothetical protein